MDWDTSPLPLARHLQQHVADRSPVVYAGCWHILSLRTHPHGTSPALDLPAKSARLQEDGILLKQGTCRAHLCQTLQPAPAAVCRPPSSSWPSGTARQVCDRTRPAQTAIPSILEDKKVIFIYSPVRFVSRLSPLHRIAPVRRRREKLPADLIRHRKLPEQLR